MFNYLGSATARRPWLTCAVWLLLGIGLAVVAPSWDANAHDDDIRFLPACCASVRGYELLEKAFPHDVCASRVVFAFERTNGPLTEADLSLVDEVASSLRQLRQEEPALQIKKITSQRDPFIGKRLLSDDGQCTLLQVSLGTPYLALQTRATVDRAEAAVRDGLAGAGIEGLTVCTTGAAGVGRDLIAAGGSSLESTTLATVLLVIVILLMVYRSPLLALVPLVTIALATWVALNILALCTLIPGFHLVNISRIFAVVMLYGAGTDYCLFLISRYREELSLGSARLPALARSVGGVGGALAASAGTVICGLSLMGLAEFAKVRCGGPAIAIGLAVALAASLTLTPALLRILGKAVFWPVGVPGQRDKVTRWQGDKVNGPRLSAVTLPPCRMVSLSSEREGVWGWISHQVVAHPLLIWSAALLVLAPLAFLGLRVRASYRATAELSPGCSSVVGLDVIKRHFTAGEVGPVTVLLQSDQDWDSPTGRHVIEHLSQGFALLPNVAEVRSLTQPLGKPLEDMPPPPQQKRKNLRGSLFTAVWRNVVQNLTEKISRTTRAVYTARVGRGKRNASQDEAPLPHVTRLDVVLRTDPFDPRSIATLEVLQTWLDDELDDLTKPMGEVRAETYGVTVNARDLAEVTDRDRRRINLLVLAGIFVILLVLVRRPTLAAYLLVTVLLSYFATLGATALLAHYWHARPLGEVDWRVPFFLFTILVAVGEDYNILLISRTLEEIKRHGGIEGTRRALAHTGGTITSCGLIMAGTFATLILAGLNTLVQVGFALAFGVLVDTFIVRPFLVPAFTLWLWRNEAAPQQQQQRHQPLARARARIRRAA
jgi:RND superfamily putative drug exporter